LATKGKHHDTKPCLACITTASMIRLRPTCKVSSIYTKLDEGSDAQSNVTSQHVLAKERLDQKGKCLIDGWLLS
jgi:hypothetical protein